MVWDMGEVNVGRGWVDWRKDRWAKVGRTQRWGGIGEGGWVELEGHSLKRMHELKKGEVVRWNAEGGQGGCKGERERDQRVMKGVRIRAMAEREEMEGRYPAMR